MKLFGRFFLFLGVLMFLGLQTSCVHYQRYSMAKSRLQKVNPDGLSVYVVDIAHPLTKGWYLSDPKFEQNKVSGFISRMAEVEILETSLIRDRSDAQQSRNDILLYVKTQYASTLPDTASLTIESTQLEKIEVCELNHLRTIGMPLLGCTGALVLAYLITGDY